MRLTKEMIKDISLAVAMAIETKKVATLKKPTDAVAARIAEIITSDLQAEDELDREVERLLSAHESEIARTGTDYRKLFEMTKQKIARDRGLII